MCSINKSLTGVKLWLERCGATIIPRQTKNAIRKSSGQTRISAYKTIIGFAVQLIECVSAALCVPVFDGSDQNSRVLIPNWFGDCFPSQDGGEKNSRYSTFTRVHLLLYFIYLTAVLTRVTSVNKFSDKTFDHSSPLSPFFCPSFLLYFIFPSLILKSFFIYLYSYRVGWLNIPMFLCWPLSSCIGALGGFSNLLECTSAMVNEEGHLFV